MLNNNRYVDLISNRAVIKTPNGKDTQVYSFDWKTRTIKVKSNGQSLDMRNKWVYIYGTDSKWYQLWRYNEKTKLFKNQQGKVM